MFLYPWGDFHSLNLGWFLLQFKEWTEKIEEYLDNGGGTSENLANVIAPVFNAENSYLTGDYVLYNNELYKALEAVPAGTWNPDAWQRCLVTEEMGSSASGVDNVARLMIAGEYSNTYNYQKYGICRYNDKLWMSNTDLPAGGEEWNPVHWDEITVGAGLTGLRRSVETISNAITAINEALSDETDARENADSLLQNSLLVKVNSRATAITNLNQLGNDSSFFVAADTIIIGNTGVSISQYARGVFINYDSNEAGLLAVTIDGKFIWAYRVSGSWTFADSSENLYTAITNSNPFLERNTSATDIDLTANAYTQLATLTLEAGTWVINAYTWLSDTGTDYYNSNISTNYGNSTCIFPAYNGGSNSNTMIVTFPTTQTIAINVFYTRAIKASCAVKAFRINK